MNRFWNFQIPNNSYMQMSNKKKIIKGIFHKKIPFVCSQVSNYKSHSLHFGDTFLLKQSDSAIALGLLQLKKIYIGKEKKRKKKLQIPTSIITHMYQLRNYHNKKSYWLIRPYEGDTDSTWKITQKS